MPTFRSHDGVELAYRLVGQGPPVVCVPGGPGRAGAYLGDLGGAVAGRTLVVLDNRGTGRSASPRDPEACGMDRAVQDVEALRQHLGIDRLTLLGHSSAGNVLALYAYAFPNRAARLVFVGPSTRAVGLAVDGFLPALERRAGEVWYADAYAAMMRWAAAVTVTESLPFRAAAAPFFYGRWDEAARRHAEAEPHELAVLAAEGFYATLAHDPGTVRRRLAELPVPVLVVVGELDPYPTPATGERLAALFPNGKAVIQPNAGHYPWIDDAHAFGGILTEFLSAE